MKIIRAEHAGMCFGVRDAIALARRQSDAAPLTILGDLVHNETVLAQLRVQGVKIVKSPDDIKTSDVMITAHGTSDRVRQQLERRGLNVLEATCPLVTFAHVAVADLVRSGFHPVIIGRRDHAEVRGLTGDLREFDVVLNESDVAALTEHPRFGIAAQTTQPMDKVEHLIELIRQRFPHSEIRVMDTVCRPTKQRQAAAVALAQQCDVVVVIGGATSNNTQELVATSRRHCTRVHHVQNTSGLMADWFIGANTVGITAGTSTPDEVIDAVQTWLENLAKNSMNTPLTPSLSPSEGERGTETSEIPSTEYLGNAKTSFLSPSDGERVAAGQVRGISGMAEANNRGKTYPK